MDDGGGDDDVDETMVAVDPVGPAVPVTAFGHSFKLSWYSQI